MPDEAAGRNDTTEARDQMSEEISTARGAIAGQPLPRGLPADLISLGGGYAFPDTLPDISAEAAYAAREFRTEALQYGPLYGLPELRDEIVRYVGQDGVRAARDNIFVVNGSKQVLDLALRAFVAPGDGVIVSRPSYATALHIIRNHGASLIEVGMDEDGMIVDELSDMLRRMRSTGQALPRLLFDVPDLHNPTGITLSEDRRRRLTELAEQYDFLIVEDDPYRSIRFDGISVPPIKSFDAHGRVIAAGTFSKVFGPGIRVGWANAVPRVLHAMAIRKSDGGVSPLTQRIILECLRSGKIERHMQALNPILESHRDAMVTAVRRYLPQASFRVPQGGYYMWLELPAEYDGDEVVRVAEQEGVGIFSGRGYFASNPPGNHIRLCYATCIESKIDDGVRRLGDVVQRLHNVSGKHACEPAPHHHFD